MNENTSTGDQIFQRKKLKWEGSTTLEKNTGKTNKNKN